MKSTFILTQKPQVKWSDNDISKFQVYHHLWLYKQKTVHSKERLILLNETIGVYSFYSEVLYK